MKDFVFSILFAAAGAFIGYGIAQNHMKDEAVENGVACYVLDENHERQFEWGNCDDR